MLYVQDTPRCIHPKFADDLVGSAVAKDLATVQRSLQTVLDELSGWSDEWDMILNISKTKVMLFGSSGGTVNLTLRGVVVEQVDCIKYLGVWLDNQLTFMQQVAYAVSMATRAAWRVNTLIEGRKRSLQRRGLCCINVSFVRAGNFPLQHGPIYPRRGSDYSNNFKEGVSERFWVPNHTLPLMQLK